MEKTMKYDVVIVGGGTSGCACAYNCAKNNLKTLLIEKNNFLGGLMTGGLVVPIMKAIYSVTDYKSSARGMVFALPVSYVTGMTHIKDDEE